MKRMIMAFICLVIVMMFCCCSETDTLTESDLTGMWRCELYGSELLIEFTPDNRFISHTDGIENRYTVEDGCIITYVEGSFDDGVKIIASVKDGVLTFGSVEYVKVN